MQVDNLILTKSLGKGSFGEVFLTKKVGGNELYATKRMDRSEYDRPENKKRLINEINILQGINHTNIVKLIELKKTRNHIYIVTEFCNGGSLSDNLRKYQKKNNKPFSEEIVQYLMRQIVSGIYYLHQNRIIHRDLKLDNILVTFPNENDKQNSNMLSAVVKIIDFGFATKLKQNHDLTNTVLGTPANMEPHLIKNMEKHQPNLKGYNEKVDIWSLGTLCYEMLVGRLTFSGNNMNELYQKIKIGNYKMPLFLSKEAVSFLNGMLQYDEKKRLSASDLIKHDFLVKNVKLFQPVNKEEVKGKIKGNNININIMNNNTIWGIFNAQDKNNNNINNIEKPLGEEEESKHFGTVPNMSNIKDEEKNKHIINNKKINQKVINVPSNKPTPEINSNINNKINPSQKPIAQLTSNKPTNIQPQPKLQKVKTIPLYELVKNQMTFEPFPQNNKNITNNNQININSKLKTTNHKNIPSFEQQQISNYNQQQSNIRQNGQANNQINSNINRPQTAKVISVVRSKGGLNDFY